MQVQFMHLRRYKNGDLCARGGDTFALEVPSREELNAILAFEDPTLALGFGRARCRDDENYSKALGRTYSATRMEIRSFTVTNIQLLSEERVRFLLQSKQGDRVYLVGRKHSNRLYFTSIE